MEADKALELTWKTVRDQAIFRMTKVRKHINSLSVFHDKLPVELQVKILLQVVQQHASGVGRRKKRPLSPLHLLARVSTRWHTLIVGTPELWSFINLYEPDYPIISTLRRSGNAPLQIRCDDTSGYRQDSVSEHLRFVGKHAHRWRTFTLKSCDADIVPDLQTCLSSADMLKELELEVRIRRVEEEANIAFDLSQNSRLVRLDCRGTRLSVLSIPTVHLQSLSLAWDQSWSLPIQDLLEIFQTCQLLEELNLVYQRDRSSLSAPFESPDALGNRLEMPRLQDIRLKNLPSQLTAHLLCRLNPGPLRYLVVVEDHPDWGTEVLGLLVNSPGSSLLQSTSSTPPTDRSHIAIRYHPPNRRLTVRAEFDGEPEGQDRGFMVSFEISWPQVVDGMSKLHLMNKIPMNLRLQDTSNVDVLRLGEITGLAELEIIYEPFTVSVFQYLSQRQIMENGELGWPCPDLTKIRLHGPSAEQLRQWGDALVQIRNEAAKPTEGGEGSGDPKGRVKALDIVYSY